MSKEIGDSGPELPGRFYEVVKVPHRCQRCQGEGFYFRLPSGMNPFAASIEVTCREMRRIKCDCGAAFPRAERSGGAE